MGYEKFVMDADQAGMMHTLLAGVDLSRERPGAGCDPRGRPGQALPRLRAHAGELPDRLLPLAAGRQQQRRAVGGGGRQGHDRARQRAVEEAARRVRGPAAGSGRRRGAARLHERAARPRSPTRTCEARRARGGPERSGRGRRRPRAPARGAAAFGAGSFTDLRAGSGRARSCAGCPSPRRSAPGTSARSRSRSSPPGAPAPRSCGARQLSSSAMRAPVPAALPAEATCAEIAVRDHAEHHGVLDVDVAAEGAGEADAIDRARCRGGPSAAARPRTGRPWRAGSRARRSA